MSKEQYLMMCEQTGMEIDWDKCPEELEDFPDLVHTAMNVFYAGIDNPISVSAPMPNFKASGPGMRAGKGAGQYVIKPRKSGDVTINVVGTDENGKTVQLGKQKFRVKRRMANKVQ